MSTLYLLLSLAFARFCPSMNLTSQVNLSQYGSSIMNRIIFFCLATIFVANVYSNELDTAKNQISNGNECFADNLAKGLSATPEFDVNGKLIAIATPKGKVQFTYHPNGRPNLAKLDNGDYVEWIYDSSGEVRSLFTSRSGKFTILQHDSIDSHLATAEVQTKKLRMPMGNLSKYIDSTKDKPAGTTSNRVISLDDDWWSFWIDNSWGMWQSWDYSYHESPTYYSDLAIGANYGACVQACSAIATAWARACLYAGPAALECLAAAEAYMIACTAICAARY
jgi:hypothetical protein